jgi:hypothetical protein
MIYVFTCLRGVYGYTEAGHGFYRRTMRGAMRAREAYDNPWRLAVDGHLAPRDGEGRDAPEMPQGVAAVHHKDGWTAVSFWDRTGDRRGNSSTTFLMDIDVSFDTVIGIAKTEFPELFERFGFEVVEHNPDVRSDWPSRAVRFDYVNYRGRLNTRHVTPLYVFFGANEWHPESQWLLVAYDFDKRAERTFAMRDISNWEDAR